MPILDVEIVTAFGETLDEGLARALADLAGEVFGSEPGRTWVRLRQLPESHYAENDAVSVLPVFVSVLLRDLPAGGALRAQAHLLAAGIGEACGRPAENVHILYQPKASGRIAFGGDLG